ncbi:mechanosensitive ion channel domain-containing protein [Erythrobacter sp. 3-20A1M]|uniref:mechanosensitive ion channel family protein n=1 Tax=Erythrobacter sp. 3-20A1M TaxID=2653850 RepID=UPI0035305137
MLLFASSSVPQSITDLAPSEAPIPTDTGSATASASATPVPTATPSPAETAAAADDIREAVNQKSQTVGDIVDKLDSMAITVGKFHISVWDVMVWAMIIALVIVLAYLLTKASHALLKRLTKLDMAQRLLAEKLVSIAVWAGSILLGIDLLGIDLTALAVFSGAFGLAIGFGLQKTFGNLIAGIILLMDRSIKPGDVIATADSTGNFVFGQIRKIGIRAVSITTRDQREYLIPNENLMVNQVENWSYSSKNVRIQVPVGVSYQCDIKLAEELMLEAAKSAKRVLASPPPLVWLDNYGNSSVDFIISAGSTIRRRASATSSPTCSSGCGTCSRKTTSKSPSRSEISTCGTTNSSTSSSPRSRSGSLRRRKKRGGKAKTGISPTRIASAPQTRAFKISATRAATHSRW